MKKILFIFSCLFIFSISAGFAATREGALTPIQSITLTYDLGKASLHVEAVHPSANWEKDYVRMMTVSLNGQIVSTFNYYHQTLTQGFSDDVSLKAQAADVITVALFSTEGNSLSQDLTVGQQQEAAPSN